MITQTKVDLRSVVGCTQALRAMIDFQNLEGVTDIEFEAVDNEFTLVHCHIPTRCEVLGCDYKELKTLVSNFSQANNFSVFIPEKDWLDVKSEWDNKTQKMILSLSKAD